VGAMEKALKVEVGEDKVAQRRRLGESKFLHE
jgi:predicted RNA-binding protein